MQTEETSSPYVRQCCQIPVPDPRNHSQYIVSVRPKAEEKLIKSSDNSEFAPSLLHGEFCDGTVSSVTRINSGFPRAKSSCLSLSVKSPGSKLNRHDSRGSWKFSSSNNATMTVVNNMKEDAIDLLKHIDIKSLTSFF